MAQTSGINTRLVAALITFISAYVVPYYQIWLMALLLIMPGINYYWWFKGRSIFRQWWITHQFFLLSIQALWAGGTKLDKSGSMDIAFGCVFIMMAILYYGLCLLATYECRRIRRLFLTRLTDYTQFWQAMLALQINQFIITLTDNIAKQMNVNKATLNTAENYGRIQSRTGRTGKKRLRIFQRSIFRTLPGAKSGRTGALGVGVVGGGPRSGMDHRRVTSPRWSPGRQASPAGRLREAGQ